MFHFEGTKGFTKSSPDLWSKLNDASFLIQCIPDIQKVTQAEKDIAGCVLRPGFAFVRGTLDMTMRITEAVPEKSIRVAVSSKGIGSSSTVEASLSFTPIEAGTQIHWAADVKEMGGLLKAVPQGLIQAAAQKVIADVWTAIEGKINSAS
jgi:carbon monoxide dehydrogenase subunit G